MIPGEVKVGEGNIICNPGRKTVKVKAINTGDRPVQIGSHFHFFGKVALPLNCQLFIQRFN